MVRCASRAHRGRHTRFAKFLVVAVASFVLEYSLFSSEIDAVDVFYAASSGLCIGNHAFEFLGHPFSLEPCCTWIERSSRSSWYILGNALSIQCTQNHFFAQSLKQSASRHRHCTHIITVLAVEVPGLGHIDMRIRDYAWIPFPIWGMRMW